MNANSGPGDGKRRALTVVPASDKSDIAAAAHVYETTGHIADRPTPHRVDLEIGETPPTPRRSFFRRRSTRDGERVHRLADPTRTGFAVGFGAAAGAFAFRAIVALIGAAILIELALAALSYFI